MLNPNRFYTYAYLRENKTPYYIGKGTKYRAFCKTRKSAKLPKDKSRIIFLKQNLTEEEAFKHEKYMIDVFGRKNLGTGILHNRTDGGDGISGYRFSNESKKRKSELYTGRKRKPHTEETKEKLREARLKQKNPRAGTKHKEQTKELIRKKKSRYLYTLTSPQGKIFYITSPNLFCTEHPEFNLHPPKIRLAAVKNNVYKNWTVKRSFIENNLDYVPLVELAHQIPISSLDAL